MTGQTSGPVATVSDSNLRALVAIKLGRDPIEYARELRDSTNPPMAWNRIADLIKQRTDVYLTQEAVRRWVKADDVRRREAADGQEEAA